MNANKRTEFKQNDFYSDHANTHTHTHTHTHTTHVGAEVIYKTELWFMKSLKCRLNIIFCHQPLRAFINICICQWHVILPLVTPSSTIRLGIAITSTEDITEPHLKVCLCPILFPTFESVFLLGPLTEKIQSV
jgi:hypothetical protein